MCPPYNIATVRGVPTPWFVFAPLANVLLKSFQGYEDAPLGAMAGNGGGFGWGRYDENRRKQWGSWRGEKGSDGVRGGRECLVGAVGGAVNVGRLDAIVVGRTGGEVVEREGVRLWACAGAGCGGDAGAVAGVRSKVELVDGGRVLAVQRSRQRRGVRGDSAGGGWCSLRLAATAEVW